MRIRSVARTVLALVGASLLGATLCACGAARQHRPTVVATWPAEAQVLPGGVAAVRVAYDTPVTLLNPAAIGATGDGVGIGVRLLQREEDPTAIYVLPSAGASFPVDREIKVFVVAGAVINEDQHYALDTYVLTFRTGPASDLWVGRGGVVTPLDRETLAAGTDVPTPGGRLPRDLLRIDQGGLPRVWVQLGDGGGSGEALAWFAPGAAAMTTVPLTTAGGDLLAPAPTMTVDPDGRYILAAYRDVAAGRVRIVRVDLVAAAEVDSLLLSIAADASTAPLGMALDDDRGVLLVSCEGPAGSVLAQVDLTTFSEIDRDPLTVGTGAQPIAVGAGPTTYGRGNASVAELGGDRAALLDVSAYTGQDSPHGLTGTHVAQVITRDRTMRLAALAGYVGTEGLVQRTVAATFAAPVPISISDDVGGVSTGATAVTALGRYSFEDRFLVVLDTDVATRWRWDGVLLQQDDLDDVTDGIQGIDVSATAPGIHVVGRELGALPPPLP